MDKLEPLRLLVLAQWRNASWESKGIEDGSSDIIDSIGSIKGESLTVACSCCWEDPDAGEGNKLGMGGSTCGTSFKWWLRKCEW